MYCSTTFNIAIQPKYALLKLLNTFSNEICLKLDLTQIEKRILENAMLVNIYI